MTVRQPKVGLIGVALAAERVDLAEQSVLEAQRSLTEEGLDLVGDSAVRLNSGGILEATKTAAEKRADCVVYLIGTWVYAPDIVAAMRQVDLPYVIWGIPEPASFSSVGANVVHGALDELGTKHKLVYGFPSDRETLEEISRFARAAMAVQTLKGSRFGLVGGRSLGMYPSTVDPIQVKGLFGVEIEHIDQFLMIEYAREIQDADVLPLYEQMKEEFGRINVPKDVMLKSIKVYSALKRVVEERDLSFVGVKCLEEVINRYVSCCLAISFANDEGIVTACQSDVNAAIAMKVLHTVTGTPPIFADVNNVNKHTRVATLVNCGTMPTTLAEDGKAVDWNHQYEYMGQARGACPTFCCKPGAVTFGTLSRITGDYVMQIANGEAFTRPREALAEVRDIWPQAFITLACDPGGFFQDLRSNHAVVGYGDVKGELVEFCKLLDIRLIVND